jgi:hypothetical protein
MKYKTPDRCPVCKSRRHVVVSGSENDMFVHGYRGVHLRGCVDCGTVYIPETLRRRIQESVDKEEAE